jgi:branched-chain amino acid transport system substrate-binding protein
MGGAHAQAPGERIKIGALLSATGPAAAFGTSSLIGARMAVAEINESGGILGRQVELVSADDQGDNATALAEAIRLTQREKIDYMIGPQLSTEAIAIGPTMNTAGIMWVTTTGASGQLTTQFVPRHFSLLYKSETQAGVLAQAAADAKYKSVAILTDDTSSQLGVIEVLKTALPARGVAISGIQQWHFGATDTTPQLLSLRRGNPDGLIAASSSALDLGYVLKNINEIGWGVPILGNGSFATGPQQVMSVSGPEALKKVSSLVYTGLSACANAPLGQSLYAQMLVKLKKFYPASEKVSLLNVASGYDMVYILKYAASAVGSLDGAKMTAWMEQNASRLNLVYSPVRASPTDHFMLGPESQTMGQDVANPRPDGLIKRANC